MRKLLQQEIGNFGILCYEWGVTPKAKIISINKSDFSLWGNGFKIEIFLDFSLLTSSRYSDEASQNDKWIKILLIFVHS